MSPATPLHEESLVRIPLVGQLLADELVALRARAVDRRWTYERVVPVSVTGFNPFTDAIYYGAHSALARWLGDPAGSARDHNEGDFLVHEVLFAAHDYLHVWAAQVIRALVPERRFGRGVLDERQLEDHIFLHLVTEAVATVGLDYWYLATVDLNRVVPLGTNHSHLATTYREAELGEYRRGNPTLTVQTPGFFVELARFYCTGRWPGFDVGDLRRSPTTYRWLRHELAYGAAQRRIVRRWLRYLATGAPVREQPEDAAPVAIDAPWQEHLLHTLGEALWRKVQRGEDIVPRRRDDTPAWISPAHAEDFRFRNANVVPVEGLANVRADASGDDNAAHLIYQLLSRRDFARFDPDLRAILADPTSRHDPRRVARLCATMPAVAEIEPGGEPADLLLLN